MFSDSMLFNRPLGLRMLAAMVLAVLTLASACGRKEAPRPPALMVPVQTQDMSLIQRGDELIISFAYPLTTPSGLPLPPLSAVEIWRHAVPLSAYLLETTDLESTEEPEADGLATSDVDTLDEPTSPEAETEGEAPVSMIPMGIAFPEEDTEEAEAEIDEAAVAGEAPALAARDEDDIKIESQEFVSIAQQILALEGPDLETVVVGDRIVVRSPLPSQEDEAQAFHYSVRTRTSPKLVSKYSNIVTFIPREAPEPPTSLAAEAQPAGVRLTWESDQQEIEAFHVYRRNARSQSYQDPIWVLPADSSSFTDSQATLGERYIYTVTSVLLASSPVIESRFASEHEIDYQDRFAPPQPHSLVALAETSRVRLLWDMAVVEDFAGFFVQRRDGDGEFQSLNDELITGLELIDDDIESGGTYLYQVIAVDHAGNRSEPSEEIEVQIP